jgi:oligogalacturonide lyase
MDTHEIVQVITGANTGDLLLGHKKNVAYHFRNNQVIFNLMGHIDRLRKNPTGIVLLNIRTNESKLLGQAKELGGYWHATGTPDLKWAVGDTFDGNIYRLNIASGAVTLLSTGHRPNTKSPFSSQAHAHQSISPDGKWVLFNSSMLIDSDIMLIPLQP